VTDKDQALFGLIVVVAFSALFWLAFVFTEQSAQADSFLDCDEPEVLYWTQPWAGWGESIRPVYDLTPPCNLQ
jgi:hypothetical protein